MASSRRLVSSGSPLEPEIGFSRAVRSGPYVCVAGTAPIAEGGGTEAPDDVYAQSVRCLDIAEQALEEAGASLAFEHISKLLAHIRKRNAMPVIHAADATVHHLHETSFTSYASPSRGSRELCAWRIEIPARTHGVPHHVSREEVLYILSGTLGATVDGQTSEAAAGDVILVPAGSRFGVGNPGDEPATAWVTTSVGFAGVLPDGSRITPPWTL